MQKRLSSLQSCSSEHRENVDDALSHHHTTERCASSAQIVHIFCEMKHAERGDARNGPSKQVERSRTCRLIIGSEYAAHKCETKGRKEIPAGQVKRDIFDEAGRLSDSAQWHRRRLHGEQRGARADDQGRRGRLDGARAGACLAHAGTTAAPQTIESMVRSDARPSRVARGETQQRRSRQSPTRPDRLATTALCRCATTGPTRA
jgi:hypothetical protein